MTRRLISPMLALVVAVVALASAPVKAQLFEEPMMFQLAENSEHNLKWVSAIGSITVDTPAAFERFAGTVKEKGLWIEFNSPGGTVIPALFLGELIRKHGFNADVGLTLFRGRGRDTLVPGFCMSACGYAFLGGVKREIQADSVLGYHQFYRDPKAELDEATDARMSKAVTEYLGEYLGRMGIDSALLKVASATKPTDYYEPSDDELVSMRIVTMRATEAEASSDLEDTSPGKGRK